MTRTRFLVAAVNFVLLMIFVANLRSVEAPSNTEAGRFQKMLNDGNFKDAYEGFRRLALDPKADPANVGNSLNLALSALQQLGRLDEIDELRENVIKVHAKNWRLLMAAAETYLNYEHFGYIVAGKFSRGPKRGGGDAVNSTDRDRVRALQLMVQAMPLAATDADKPAVSEFWSAMSRMLLSNRGYDEAWRLQYLTDLAELPDYDQGWYRDGGAQGAPVDADGNPVFHHIPKSWDAAQTDGQRWRWSLLQAMENNPSRKNEINHQFAEFLQNQFGVQTMAYYGPFFGGLDEADDGKKDESGTWALHTLAEDETIARLASGIQRFKLPQQFDFIRIFREIAEAGKSNYGESALDTLAQIFENRRQYPRAAELWKRSIEDYGSGNNHFKSDRLQQITGNWSRFESVAMQPAGKGASVEFCFRNGRQVSFEAHEIDVAKLLADVKAYLKSNPRHLQWDQVNIGDVGYRLVQQNQTKYLGRRVAEWDLKLEPRPQHFDRRITVTTPLQKAGAYLVTAKMADGNTSKIILWVADTAIVKKPLSGGMFCYVGDAVTGAPVATANVEFFGYRQRQVSPNQFSIDTQNFAEATDADGQLIFKGKDKDNQFQWIITATAPGGRLAYLGFTNVWGGNYSDAEYNQSKVFTITDRPVYRPSQKVNFKFWVRHARYDQEDKSDFANQTFTVEIQNPKGEKVLSKSFTGDAYGGIEGQFDLPADATLGVYQLYVVNHGGGSFRVEEYKKPEFEVTVDAPSEPVMLGDKITATIKAKYYFGSPVAEAKVKYKVIRSNYNQRWFPTGRWDWLYGPGYWWFGGNYDWYPGWRMWGCARPAQVWWWGFGAHQPPEVVAEGHAPLKADGSFEIAIDTAVAKLIHPDKDHQYSITAEVTDRSRRTIVGQGNVLVARRPFKVYTWVNRGYYRVGDVIHAEFQSQTLDHKPVRGEGVATLYKVTYKDDQPVETEVRNWELDPDARGHADLQIEASAAGQYRLSYKVADEKKHEIEGAYIFTIVGEGFDGRDFKYNDLELVPDNKEYQPGQTVNLMVNTDRVGGTVLLFPRPANGIYLPPKVLRLKGKSTVEELRVEKKDMPNFFVEAVAIAGGQLHVESREIVVPPESRMLDVAITPSKEEYKPGDKAAVKIKLTDANGKPFVGSTVVAIYDKAVEYIAGGSNVEDIKAFFWKWRRSHYPHNETNLLQLFSNLIPPGQNAMSNLGIFGDSVAEEQGAALHSNQALRLRGVSDGNSRTKRMAVAAPAAAPMMMAGDALERADVGMGYSASLEGQPADEAGAPMVQPTVRSNFADTALWAGAITTDESGVGQVSLTMPENLTTWKVRVWSMGHGTKVGQADVDVVTRKNLIVRLQGSRFFLEKDEVVLSANVHNYLKSPKRVTVALELEGKCLAPLGDTTQQVEVTPGGEARVDWRVKVAQEGEAVIRMKGLTDEESDAVEQRFPVYVHGMLKMESFSGALRPDDTTGKITLHVPKERRISESRLEVRYSPTLAGAMVDALPYMVEYPYGCTEQTLNRFLPTVITQNILINMGLDLKKIQEKRTNLNAQEIGDDQERAKGWKRFDRNPVFDQAEVARMVKDGVARLTEMQLADGGWGWFSGWGELSYPHTTAVVVHGLQVAQQNDVALVPGVLEKGIEWLKAYQQRQIERLKNGDVKPKPKEPYKTSADATDALVYMALVDAKVVSDDMRAFLYRDRTKLPVYAKALFGLALHQQHQHEQLDMILKNIEQFVQQDEENQTAFLKLPKDNWWWYWYGSEIEANAYYLKLLTKTDPQGKLASRLVKYLLNNRKHATYWNSTRDTALAIEALADFIKASGEGEPDLTVEVWLDGKKQKEVKITAADLFTFDNKFVLQGDAVETGKHTLELRKSGTGPLYYNAYLTNFTLEDYIKAAGLEVKVSRKFYKLNPVDKEIKVSGSRGQAVDQKVEKYQRQELDNLATLTSGDLVEVELEIDSKNDYEYLMFEDMKAAGFEPVEVRSGYGNPLGAYMELRDNRVTFFVRELARGKHSVSYRLRAEIPGQFSALPAIASAMYAPELKGNSDEIKLKIAD
ncbi:MAG: alpha-2-macroglobulin [Pirellulales bacterium]|nr:alpha-2-macroglobulin [Pirellulales bacterium]